MPQAICLRDHGGPETLKLESVELAPVGPGELRVRQTAIGVNYHDVYVRSGLYKTLALPGIPGIEAVGVVEDVASDVVGFKPGDRIGYVAGSYGGYASERNLPAVLAVKLPDILEDVPGAASLMKAMTTCMLLRRVHVVEPGETILVHAAAGGVGQLLCGWASHLGAHVIGTVGHVDKVAIAKEAGAHDVILYREEDFAVRVGELTGGEGVAAVYDSVGADTFAGSIDSLGFEGHLVNFGQASGPVAPFGPQLLATRSLSISRPIIFHYLRTPEKLRAIAAETFAAFEAGFIKPIQPLTLSLAEAGEAHRRLESRQSPGGIVLIPA